MTDDNSVRSGSWWRIACLVAGPLAALVVYWFGISSWPHAAAATAAVGVWMAIWWITEAIPLPATALLPIVLLPVLGTDAGRPRVGQVVEITQGSREDLQPTVAQYGKVKSVSEQEVIVTTSDTSGKLVEQKFSVDRVQATQRSSPIQTATAPFGDSNIFLYMGGFILALAVEKWGLHRRFAIGLMLCLGTSGASILLGMMLATAILSMWISNTAATTIMLPIALGICRWLDRGDGEKKSPSHSNREGAAASMLLLSIAYAATIGGMATTIGTPTNGVALNVLKQQGIEITFLGWLVIAGPIALVTLLSTWVILLLYFKQGFKNASPNASQELRREWNEMGMIRYEEWLVLGIFLFTAMSWILRGPITSLSTGWLHTVLSRVDDTVIAITGALMLFIVPANLRERKFLIDWESLKNLPWGVLLIFGGGLSLAAAMQSSGLVLEMEKGLEILRGWPVQWMLLAIVLSIVFLSEMASNVAIATAFTPIIFAMAVAIGGSPQQLVIAATLAASCGFMLPVATPPNAIVFGTGRISQQQMVRVGLILNLVSSMIVALGVRWL